jgi:septum site-determining protein MinC
MADVFEHPEALALPYVRVRGRSFMAMVIAPEAPTATWLAAFDQQMGRAANFFADRPVVANLEATLAEGGADAVLIVLDGLDARGLRLVGIEGVDARLLAGTRWERLPKTLHGRDVALEAPAGLPLAVDAEAPPEAPPSASSLLIDRPVRSGQSIVFEDGDVTIVGSVASGAEVIAGGSVHVYGSLRGRALAGLRTPAAARIFSLKYEAVWGGVDLLYRTSEHWGAGLHGRAVQVLSDRGALRLSALD